MEMGQQVLNKDSNEVKRFIEVMEGISKMLNANSLIYRPILDGNRYITEQELSKALKITKRTLIEYRMNGKLPYYKIGGKILYKEQDIIDILEIKKRMLKKCACESELITKQLRAFVLLFGYN